MNYTPERLEEKARALFKEERAKTRLDGWFLAKEIGLAAETEVEGEPNVVKKAYALKKVLETLPITLSEHAVFCGTQDDAFAKSYALINPNFKVCTFNGYCDPSAVFGDIEPSEEISAERINRVRSEFSKTPYVTELAATYAACEEDTKEVAYFVEQVTGHLIPDFRPALKCGVAPIMQTLREKIERETDAAKRDFYRAQLLTFEGLLILTERYRALAEKQKATAGDERKAELNFLTDMLSRVPMQGARNLPEAVQSFMLLWQVMCLEQTPNPFAFSVGNADRIFEPYRAMTDMDRDTARGYLEHFLVFFNVADRSWAISQNLLVGGKTADGKDLTNATSYALFDAYFRMNLPQPILSVRLHENAPDKLYEEMGKFFFTPGVLTPSLFNDDALFPVLEKHGVKREDLSDYAVAGCQEPLIMGKDNGNTTNSWLNLAKILELTLTGGKSLISGEQIGRTYQEMGAKDATDVCEHLYEYFTENVRYYAKRMANAANGASRALSNLPVPFLSAFMGGLESGVDLRDKNAQGTPYNGSGCLIHGLSVVADSLVAVNAFLQEGGKAESLLSALSNNFEGYEELRRQLQAYPKFGNNETCPDEAAARIAKDVSDIVRSQKNYLGNPFRPDWSSPTTHLLYGYWVGATPDGRKSREMLGYGVDPLFGEAQNGLGMRVLSAYKLPYEEFNGGYASHLGLDPKYFCANTVEEKGLEFKTKIFNPLFFPNHGKTAPFYVYFNVTTPETLRKVLQNPKKYAPSGVYIMRIHGTFVNFLDLSPEIQEDIIKRLDLGSTTC
ncbi:MAG: hypothetical protein II368_01335 [Clostridia bacterium]|nr:hypothetical protein [Clostridia bacterium]